MVTTLLSFLNTRGYTICRSGVGKVLDTKRLVAMALCNHLQEDEITKESVTISCIFRHLAHSGLPAGDNESRHRRSGSS